MEESNEKGLRGHPGNARERLSPTKAANFPGSLVVNHLDVGPKTTCTPQNKRSVADWVAYFKDGWDDIGIWKSAVSI